MTSRGVIDREQRRPSKIRPFLYVGGISALSPKILARFGTVINCIPSFRLHGSPHLKILHIPIEDDHRVDLAPYWTTVFQAIDDERARGGRCLLMCGMGISRSATFAIAYCMCIEKMTLHDAYKHVQGCRNVVCPNVGFFKQMIELEEKMYGQTSVRMIEPLPRVIVADVVWKELYDEMMSGMSESDRDSLRQLNTARSLAPAGNNPARLRSRSRARRSPPTSLCSADSCESTSRLSQSSLEQTSKQEKSTETRSEKKGLSRFLPKALTARQSEPARLLPEKSAPKTARPKA